MRSGSPFDGPLPGDRRSVRFDCPMCTRVQRVSLADARCESCGARLRLFADAGAARAALASVTARSRHLRELAGDLYLVASL